MVRDRSTNRGGSLPQDPLQPPSPQKESAERLLPSELTVKVCGLRSSRFAPRSAGADLRG